jgi:hypothetical protein
LRAGALGQDRLSIVWLGVTEAIIELIILHPRAALQDLSSLDEPDMTGPTLFDADITFDKPLYHPGNSLLLNLFPESFPNIFPIFSFFFPYLFLIFSKKKS